MTGSSTFTSASSERPASAASIVCAQNRMRRREPAIAAPASAKRGGSGPAGSAPCRRPGTARADGRTALLDPPSAAARAHLPRPRATLRNCSSTSLATAVSSPRSIARSKLPHQQRLRPRRQLPEISPQPIVRSLAHLPRKKGLWRQNASTGSIGAVLLRFRLVFGAHWLATAWSLIARPATAVPPATPRSAHRPSVGHCRRKARPDRPRSTARVRNPV